MYTVKRMPEFDEWFDSLKDAMTRIRLAKRLDKAERGLLGDVEPVGEGVFEMREFFGPGWRMYFAERNGRLIVLLGATFRKPLPYSRPWKDFDHDQENQCVRFAGL